MACMRPLQRMGEEIGDDDLAAVRRARRRRSSASSRRWPHAAEKQRCGSRLKAPRRGSKARCCSCGARSTSACTTRSRCAARDGRARLGRMAAIDDEHHDHRGAGVDVRACRSPTPSCASSASRCRSALSPGILGRVFNGVGQVIDGGPPVAARERYPIDGLPINPVARAMPRDFIETGITTLDLMNSLVRGQKLPLFSGGGLPHDRLAVEIAGHARLRGMAGAAGTQTARRTVRRRLRDRVRRHRRALRQRRVLPPRASSRAARSSAPRCSSTSRAIRRRSGC